VVGVVGRETSRVCLEVVERADRATLERVVEDNTTPGCTVDTDEWRPYGRLGELDRRHVAVSHAPGRREWARDDDGDGIREAQNNAMEGRWVGLRNFLRPFRGVSKHYLGGYAAVFQWTANRKRACPDFVQALTVTNFAR
jgi:transposase